MRTKVIYCEIDFLRVLFERLTRTYSPLDEDWEEGACARKIIKILSNELTRVHFDDQQKFSQLQKENEYFFKMIKRAESTEGYAEKDCEAYVTLKDAGEKELNSAYFVVSEKGNEDDKGILFLTPDTVNNKCLYEDSGQGIKDGEVCKWVELLRSAKHNCNAIIAFDNYLNKHKEINLYPILDTLLPAKLPDDISFHICLFMQEQRGVSLESEYRDISYTLNRMRPELLFDLTIFQCFTADFHDRAIITNNMWIGCEGGFDLLKKDKYGFHTQSTKDTKTHIIYPFLQERTNWSVKSYDNLIRDALSIMKSHQPIGSNTPNRLLDGCDENS